MLTIHVMCSCVGRAQLPAGLCRVTGWRVQRNMAEVCGMRDAGVVGHARCAGAVPGGGDPVAKRPG